MSIPLIDKYDVKNSALPKASENKSTIGYRDELNFDENYLLIKIKNYSSVGWVFGLAQYGVTPVTTSAQATETIYALLFEDDVTYYGNEPDLITSSNNITITNAYKNLQFTATDASSSFKHLLLKNVNSTYKFFKILIKSSIDPSEDFGASFELQTSSPFTADNQKIDGVYHGINLYATEKVKELTLVINRLSQHTTYNTNSINEIYIQAYDNLQPYTERFINNEFININETTGNLTTNRWEGNANDELVSKQIITIADATIKGVTLNFTDCDTNINSDNTILSLSTDGLDWIEFPLSQTTIFNKYSSTIFPLMFPIKFGDTLGNVKTLYYKLIAKENGVYIDTTNGPFKIEFII